MVEGVVDSVEELRKLSLDVAALVRPVAWQHPPLTRRAG